MPSPIAPAPMAAPPTSPARRPRAPSPLAGVAARRVRIADDPRRVRMADDPDRRVRLADDPDREGQTGVITKPKPKTQKPPLYKVLLLNDDYTPMEFVVAVLERFFGMSHAQAFELMLTVHKKGVAVVGVFSYEIAETKVAQVMDFAQRHQHPLQCTMEKE